MIYNFEYELKVMLTETEYERLITYDGCDAFRQTNYYFDTPAFDMYKNKVVIRIREKNDEYELTVKSKDHSVFDTGVVGMHEENNHISKETALSIIGGEEDIHKYLPDNSVYKGRVLTNVGYITTIRKLISINDDLPMAELDKSLYEGKADYELEWEISEEKYNKAIESLAKANVMLDDRAKGLSKYGRLVDRLMEDR